MKIIMTSHMLMPAMQAIREFHDDASKVVLLASLDSFSCGIDLTCASQIILVAPFRNLSVSSSSLPPLCFTRLHLLFVFVAFIFTL